MKVKTRFKNMDIFERAGAYLRPRLDRQLLVFLLPLALLFVGWPQNLKGAIHHAEVPASVAEQHMVAVSRIGNRRIVMFLVACKI